VRADDHPSQQIAENDRLVQSLEHDCRNRRDAQDYREILKEGVRIHQAEFTLVSRPFCSLWILAGQSGEGILFGSYSLTRIEPRAQTATARASLLLRETLPTRTPSPSFPQAP
jgi:hypothetical protein